MFMTHALFLRKVAMHDLAGNMKIILDPFPFDQASCHYEINLLSYEPEIQDALDTGEYVLPLANHMSLPHPPMYKRFNNPLIDVESGLVVHSYYMPGMTSGSRPHLSLIHI